MKKKLCATDFINKVYFGIAIIFFIFFAIELLTGDEQTMYFVGFIFSIFSLIVFPFGRDISLFAVKREEAYMKSLQAIKIIILMILLVFLIVFLLGKLIFHVNTSYSNLIFSIEVIFLAVMFIMYTTHLFRKQISTNKMLSIFIWIIVTLVYMAFVGGMVIFAKLCFDSYIHIHYLVTIVGFVCCSLLYIYVDKFRYKINVEFIKAYDFKAGDTATGMDLAKQYKMQNERRIANGCSNHK